MDVRPTIHVFVCENVRDGDRKCCGTSAILAREQLKTLLVTHGEIDHANVRISRSGCIGACTVGPALVFYPQRHWYTYASVDDLGAIFDAELLFQGNAKHLRICERIEDVVGPLASGW